MLKESNTNKNSTAEDHVIKQSQNTDNSKIYIKGNAKRCSWRQLRGAGNDEKERKSEYVVSKHN